LNRPTWEEYFIQIARYVSTRTTCLRRSVGAVLVRDKRILSTGYNGAPSGVPHCAEVGCLRETMRIPSGERHELCRGLHAEMNALIQAALHGVTTKGATLYCTTTPCSLCARMLINAGIIEVVALEGYPDELARDLLQQAGVRLRVLSDEQDNTESPQPETENREP